MAPDEPAYLRSADLEKVLEHRFVAELTSRLWLDGCRDFEVLRSEVDTSGYDLVVEARSVLRHIQLKSMARGGKKRSVTVNMRLASKQAGCVIWCDYNPATLELGPFRWFGTLPGLGLPDPGDKVARHSKGDANGSKNLRGGHRVLRKSKFVEVPTLGDLLPFLFGYDDTDEIKLLRHSICGTLASTTPTWLQEVCAGHFDNIPEDLQWKDSVELAHLVEGYDLAARLGLGDPFEFDERQLAFALESGSWKGGPAVLWATLFLEHRRWRTAPIEPDPGMRLLLDRLCQQLIERLKRA
ncbi:hypothetical protein [Altererythrobacter sp. C41]|uniref:hypothetical protein n=1 Tax=Altererythrobacter sp. C41 TaxID=2806021 RepID=UPI001932FAF5|nr:hypothetical protein [Altererythrobacter sp. C41]MBM0170855.1 hypothetical protein [Altererythrobacter sp. C41]